MNRALAFILSFAMLLALLPISALAAPDCTCGSADDNHTEACAITVAEREAAAKKAEEEAAAQKAEEEAAAKKAEEEAAAKKAEEEAAAAAAAAAGNGSGEDTLPTNNPLDQNQGQGLNTLNDNGNADDEDGTSEDVTTDGDDDEDEQEPVQEPEKQETFTVKFVDHDGTALCDPQTVNKGEDAKAPADPTRDGYDFTGWDPENFKAVTSDLTVTAQYEEEQEDEEVQENGAVKPEGCTCVGDVHDGQNTNCHLVDTTCSCEAGKEEQDPSKHTAVCRYRIAVSAMQNAIAPLGLPIEEKETVTATGVTVKGKDSVPMSGYGEYTAAVLPEGASQDVIWSVDDETVATIDAFGKLSPVASGTVNVTATAQDGPNASGSLAVTVLAEYTVTYASADAVMGKVSPDSETVVENGTPTGATATAEEDYYFVNWTDASGAEVSKNATLVPASPSANVAYTANFAIRETKVITFKINDDDKYSGWGATLNGQQNPVEVSVRQNADGSWPTWASIRESIPKEKESYGYGRTYTFTGWNPALPSGGTSIGELDELEYTAVYTLTSGNARTVVFQAGDNGSLANGTFTRSNSDSIKNVGWVLNGSDVPTVTPDKGYKFVGWTNGTGTYTNSTVKNVSVRKGSVVTFTAQYEEMTPVTMTFQAGANGSLEGEVSVQGYVGETYTAPKTVPDGGFLFDRWTPELPDKMPETATTYTATFAARPMVTNVILTGDDTLVMPNTLTITAQVTPDNALQDLDWTVEGMGGAATYTVNGKELTLTGTTAGDVRVVATAKDGSEVNGEKIVHVLSAPPVTISEKVYRYYTNRQRGTASFTVPGDGTAVSAASVAPGGFRWREEDGQTRDYTYSFAMVVSSTDLGNTNEYEALREGATVSGFRMWEGKLQYLQGSEWKNVGGQYIIFSYNQLRITQNGVTVSISDWTGSPTAHKLVLEVENVDGTIETLDTLYYNMEDAELVIEGIDFSIDSTVYQIDKVVYKLNKGDWDDYKSGKVVFNRNTNQTYTVRAILKVTQYTVSYDANGADNEEACTPASYQQTEKDENGNPNKVKVAGDNGLTKDGYIFLGWRYNGNTYTQGEEFDMPAANVKFVASWLKLDKAISYIPVTDGKVNDTTGGTVSRSGERFNAEQTQPFLGSTATKNTGYTFQGWYSNANGADTALLSKEATYVPTKKQATTYYAVFTANKHSLTVKHVYGTTSPEYDVNAVDTAYGTPLNYVEKAKNSYELEGIAVEGLTKPENGWVSPVAGTMPNNPVTITFTYKLSTAAYTVEHYKQNVDVNGLPATGYTKDATEPKSGTVGDTVTATAKAYDGFTENTTHKDRVPSGEVTVDGKLVLKLYYDALTYQVTASIDHGTINAPAASSGEHTATVGYNKDYTVTWTVAEGYSVTAVKDNVKDVTPLPDVSYALTGIKENHTVAVTTAINRHSVSYWLDEKAYNVTPGLAGDFDFGTEKTVADKAEKTGYTVSDWATEDVTVGQDGKFNMPDNDVVFKATSTVNQYPYVIHHVNKDDVETKLAADTDGLNTDFGTKINVADAKKDITGYTYDSISGDITIKVDDATTPTENVATIYYTRNSYELTYAYTNDPAPAGASALPIETSYEYGETVTVADDATAPDYTFTGWHTAAGEKLATVTDSTASFDMPAGNLTLYGSWTAKGTVTIQYKVGTGYESMGSVSPAEQKDIRPDSGLVSGSTATASTGYKFDNWYTDAACKTPLGTAGSVDKDGKLTLTKPDGGWVDATYYAKFEAADVGYKVEHYTQDLEGNGWTKNGDTESKSGLTGGNALSVDDLKKTIDGFTYDHATYETSKTKADTTVLTIAADGSLVIKLYYVRKTYTVTYKQGEHGTLAGQNEDGNVVHSAVKHGAVTPDAPTVNAATDYYFTGWDADTDGSADTIPATVTGDATYTALYAELGEIVVNLSSGEVGYDGKYHKLTASVAEIPGVDKADQPTLEDLQVKVLYDDVEDADGKQGYGMYAGSTTGNDRHTIGTKQYQVIYNGGTLIIKPKIVYYANNGVTPEETNDEHAKYDEKLGFSYTVRSNVDTAFSKQGYSFVNWNTARNDKEGTPYSGGDSNLELKDDVTDLYAQWNAAPNTYKVEYYLQNLALNGYDKANADVTIEDKNTGDDATFTEKTFAHFTYEKAAYVSRVGSTDTPVTGKTVLADGSLVIKVYYTRDSYNVTLTVTNGTGTQNSKTDKTVSYPYGTDVTLSWKPTDANLYYLEDVAASPALTHTDNGTTIAGIAADYEIKVTYAEKTALTITAVTTSKPYDGTALTAPDPSAPALKSKSGDKLMMLAADGGWTELKASGSVTNVEALPVTNALPDAKDITVLRDGVDVTNEYIITTADGKLTITPFDATITAGDVTVNLGATLDVDDITVTTSKLWEADDLDPIAVGYSVTNADQYGLFATEVTKYTANSNYTVTTNDGVLVVNPEIRYNGNGAAVTGAVPASHFAALQSDPAAFTATVKDSGALTNPGMVFAGWNTAANGTGTSYAAGATLTVPVTGGNNVTTLYAQWTAVPVPLYRVVYMPGAAGVGNMPAETAATLAAGSAYTISGMTPTRDGFTFTNWRTDNLATTRRYVNQGATITIPTDPALTTDNAVFLTAQWAEDEPEQYTATYTVSVVNAAGATTETYTYAAYTRAAGEAVPTAGTPARAGYTFSGWTGTRATMPAFNYTVTGTLRENVVPPEEPETPPEEPIEVIPEEDTPLAGPQGASWALLNLILAIATALASALMLVGYVGKKKDEDENGVELRQIKKHGVMRILSLLPGVGGIVAFILTENMKNPMAFTDRWTLLMVVIALIQLLVVLLSIKSEKDAKDEENMSAV